jgi:hypothetical protein
MNVTSFMLCCLFSFNGHNDVVIHFKQTTDKGILIFRRNQYLVILAIPDSNPVERQSRRTKDTPCTGNLFNGMDTDRTPEDPGPDYQHITFYNIMRIKQHIKHKQADTGHNEEHHPRKGLQE